MNEICGRCGERPGIRSIRDICIECDDVRVCQECYDLHATENVGNEFPFPSSVNWSIIRTFWDRPHALIRDIDMSGLHYSIQEVLLDAKAVHHLLDLAGVPYGYSFDTRDIASRSLLAIMAMSNLRERLDRISSIHARETGPAGTVGSYCTECGETWECTTYRMAKGTYTDT